MTVFWANGLEGTSLAALEQSTGLNRSSLYATFGDKLQLFCRALDAYSAGPCQQLFRPFQEQSGAAALLGYLAGLRAFVGSRHRQRGCMMVNTKLAGIHERPVRGRVDAHFRGLRKFIIEAYAVGLREGALDPGLSPEVAADWLVTLVRGVLAGAASGEPAAALTRSIDITTRYLSADR